MMSKLQGLIRSLKALTIIIIENDFTYQDDPYKVVSGYCFSSDGQRKKLTEELLSNGFNNITENLRYFKALFDTKDHNEVLIEKIPAKENFKFYLEKMGFNDLSKNEIFKNLIELFEKDKDINSFKNILLKYGYFSGYPNNHYDEIFQELNAVENSNIIYYKNTPSAAEESNFIETIKNNMSETLSSFYLAIIDKSLEAGGDDEAGKTFVSHLIEINKRHDLNFICCLYTSRPSTNASHPDSFSDYFVQEIPKNSQNITEQLTHVLSYSAYASVFNSIKTNVGLSSEKALNTVLKNQKNIKYIIDQSYKEGITPYEASKYWFDLAIQSQFEEAEVRDFEFIAGLTNFFNRDYLNDHPKITEIGHELRDLNTFELFDYNVNKKYTSIAPGDIFQCEDNYYILLGQLCDILLRDNDKRKTKIGELIKIKISEENIGEKYKVKVSDNKVILISYFKDTHNEFKTLEFEVSTPNTYYVDLEVLDLCMFNSNGKCQIDFNFDTNEIVKLIPNRTAFLEKLKGNFKKINETYSSTYAIDEDDPLLFSRMRYIQRDNIIDYTVRRVCRLKNRYYDSVFNNYLNNKGRIDLNLIDNRNEVIIPITLKFMIAHDDSSLVEKKQFNLWSISGKDFLKMSELKTELPEYIHLLDLCEGEIVLGESKNYELRKVNDNEYELIFKHVLNVNEYQKKERYSYNNLFGIKKPIQNPSFRINGEENDISFLNEKGFATRTLSIPELKRGVIIYEPKVKLVLNNGILIRESYD